MAAARNLTRLLIQGIVVVEVLIIIACGIGWGLCAQQDALCLPFIQQVIQQGGRQVLEQAQETSTLGLQQQHLKQSPFQKRSRMKAKLVLQLEEGSMYQQWSDAWNEWLQDTSFSQWPLWKEPPVSNVLIGGLLTTKSTTKSNHQQDETYLVSSKVVEEHFSSKLPKDVMEIVLYVPKVPLLMVNRQGKESAALTINHNRLIILVQGPNATMQDSMSYLLPFFAKHGLVGLKKDDIDYWLQGVAMSYLAQAQSEIGEAREWLLQLPTDISITRDVAERWMQTVKTLDEATKLAETKQWILAVELLEQALQRLNDLQSDPTLIPPLSLQMDHLLAIFAPLLFPLLLPMLAGLAREYKRYRTL